MISHKIKLGLVNNKKTWKVFHKSKQDVIQCNADWSTVLYNASDYSE